MTRQAYTNANERDKSSQSKKHHLRGNPKRSVSFLEGSGGSEPLIEQMSRKQEQGESAHNAEDDHRGGEDPPSGPIRSSLPDRCA
ncbi:hypothetical protein [Glutamicibacter sp.]|uniref:hypothetical protein n=1 Tax=Glutamicibacter sp. TaxID=1931995 RepID=UPI002FE33D0A